MSNVLHQWLFLWVKILNYFVCDEQGRLPVLCWYNCRKGNFMMRCAQPKTGPALKVRGAQKKVCLNHYKERFIVLFLSRLCFLEFNWRRICHQFSKKMQQVHRQACYLWCKIDICCRWKHVEGIKRTAFSLDWLASNCVPYNKFKAVCIIMSAGQRNWRYSKPLPRLPVVVFRYSQYTRGSW